MVVLISTRELQWSSRQFLNQCQKNQTVLRQSTLQLLWLAVQSKGQNCNELSCPTFQVWSVCVPCSYLVCALPATPQYTPHALYIVIGFYTIFYLKAPNTWINHAKPRLVTLRDVCKYLLSLVTWSALVMEGTWQLAYCTGRFHRIWSSEKTTNHLPV